MAGKRSLATLVAALVLGAGVAYSETVAAQVPEGGSTTPRGSLTGRVTDATSQRPLVGATVSLAGTQHGVLTDSGGGFTLSGIPARPHTVEVRLPGYSPRAVPDVIIRPGRATELRVELEISPFALEGITVAPSYFPRSAEEPTGTIAFSGEEIRRSPGSAGDLSRIIVGLPSLAKVSDQYNGLAVRGGSPSENAFYVDGIEIPNINHFPSQGSSGGAIGILNVDLVREVEFNAGGFGAAYGDRLSSVMEVALRDGNDQEFQGQVDLNWTGFGGVLEGPLPGPGSWLITGRRSYLDFLVKQADVGTTLAPEYSDLQAKISYDLGPRHRVSALAIAADDHISSDRETAIENDMLAHGRQDLTQATFGVSWRALWNDNLVSTTALSVGESSYSEDYLETATAARLLDNRSRERTLRLRNVSRLQLGSGLSLLFGLDAKRSNGRYRSFYGAHDSAYGDSVPPHTLSEDLSADVMGAFVSATLAPVRSLEVTVGGRLDYFQHTERLHADPRLAMVLAIDEATSLSASAGLYHQQLPLILLAQRDANRTLETPRATHYVVGLQRLLAADTRLTIEAYRKAYSSLPADPAQPAASVLDEPVAGNGFFDMHHQLTAEGAGRASGVEAILQKRLASRLHLLASAAYARTEYRGLDGVWRDRIYDNRLLLSAEGGYRLGQMELSGRWMYAGGPPHTPVDRAASIAAGRTVFDRDRVNAARYPSYHALSLRIDRRFNFRSSSLTAFLSVWNVYDRANVASYYWNPQTSDVEPISQMGRLPIFGLEYEF